MSGWRALVLGCLAFALIGAWAYRDLFELTLLGWDAYPMILTAKVASFGDLIGCVTEELMDGRYPDGHFWRPITNLSFALDHALWGLDARGWHATDLAILVVNALLVAALAWRLVVGAARDGRKRAESFAASETSASSETRTTNTASRIIGAHRGAAREALVAASVAGLVFLLHPIQLELLPVSPRRADALCAGFTMAAVLTLARPRGARGRRDRVLLGLLAFAAAGAKETGAIVAPLGFLAAWLLSPAARSNASESTDSDSPDSATGSDSLASPSGLESGTITSGVGARARLAFGRSAPLWIGVALFVVLRTLVLGGLGGHEESSVGALTSAPTLIEPYLMRALYPQPWIGTGDGARALIWCTAGALLLSLAFAVRRPSRSAAARTPSASVDGSTDERTTPSGASAHTGASVRPLAGPLPALAWLGGWILLLLAISSLSGRVHDWYAMLFAAPLSITLGLAIALATRAARAGDHLGAIVGGLPAALVAASLVAASPARPGSILAEDDRWERASALTTSFLQRAAAELDSAKPGDELLLDRWVPALAPPSEGRGVRSAAVLGPYSVQAWLELERPERPVLVAPWTGERPAADPTRVRIWLSTATR